MGYEKIDLEWVFKNYPDSFLQDMLVVLRSLRNEGVLIDDIINFGKAKFSEKRSLRYEVFKNIEQTRKEFHFKVRRCALCGSPMALDPVNDSNCTQVGGEFKSMWSCFDQMGCGETVYSNLVVHEEAAMYGMEKFYPDPAARNDPGRRRARTNQRRRDAVQAETVNRPCGGRK